MKPLLLALALLAADPAFAQTAWTSASACGATAQVPDHPMADQTVPMGEGTYQIRVFADSQTNQTFGLACLRDGDLFERMEARQAVSAAVFIIFGDAASSVSYTDVTLRGQAGRAFVFELEPGVQTYLYGYRPTPETVVFALFGADAGVDPSTDASAQRFLSSLTF